MSWRRPLVAVGAAAAAFAVGAGLAGGQSLIAKARSGGEQAKTIGTASLVVRGRRGRVVARRTVKAALAPSGGAELAKLFAGKYTRGAWGLAAGYVSSVGTLPGGGTVPASGQTTGPCTDSTTPFAVPCLTVGPTWTSPGTNASPNLTVAVPVSGPDASKLVLSGTILANSQGQINRVLASNELTCADGTCPKTPTPLVQANLSLPVSVFAGQKIQITFVVGLQ
jgi:hypothetical protein